MPRPGEPDALTPKEHGAVERAADRCGVRDAAVVVVLLYTGCPRPGALSAYGFECRAGYATEHICECGCGSRPSLLCNDQLQPVILIDRAASGSADVSAVPLLYLPDPQ